MLRRELRLNRRSLYTWTAVTVLVVVVYLPFFPYMQDPEFARLLETYPEAIRDAFNLTGAIFADINFYHAGLTMPYLLALAGIYAAMTAGRLISRESDLGTAEFIFTRPVTRSRVLAAKIGAFLVLNLALWGAICGAAVITGLVVDPGAFTVTRQLAVHLSGFLAALAAGGIALAAASFIDQVQGTATLGIALGLGFFIVDATSRLTERLAFLKYLNTFYYAGLEAAAAGKPFLAGLAVLAAVFIAGTGLSFVFLKRKQFTA